MALTGATLTDEVQALVGRTTNIALIDNTRVTRWQNEGQNLIAEKAPELHCLHFNNTTSLDTTVTLSYSIADITVGDSSTDERVCHIFDVWYLDGNESRHLKFTPTDEFDAKYPDPTHTDVAKTRPSIWTRRGNSIEMMPLCLTIYCDKDLRFEGSYYPGEFTTEDASAGDISGADSALIAYGVHKAWGAIGEEEKSAIWRLKFENALQELKDKSEIMHEWSGNLYDD